MSISHIILVTIIGVLAFYIQYQRRLYLEKLKERFVCYYCNHTFGIEQLDRVGKYDYCLHHGMKRQREFNV